MKTFKRLKKALTQAGLEPTISCSVGRRLIHWATEPSKVLNHQKVFEDVPKSDFTKLKVENHVDSRLIHAIQFPYFPPSKFNFLILSLRFLIKLEKKYKNENVSIF